MLTIETVSNSKQRDAFIRFPWQIYKGDPYWVPPVIKDQQRELDPEKGAFFNDSKAEFFLARRAGEIVGRIAAIRNEPHLQTHRDDVGFFGFFEAIDDPTVAKILLQTAEDWLADEGLSISRGPASFTIYDPAGVTVDGNKMRPGVGMAYTPFYYENLLIKNGYHKVRDLFAYHLDVANFDSSLLELERNTKSYDLSGFEVRSMRLNDLQNESEIFARIFTKAWENNWGAVPLKSEDFLKGAKEMGPFLDERLGYVAEFEGKPVGIFLAIADPWEILQHTNGKIGLSALFKILTKRKNIKHFRVILMGTLPEYRLGFITGLMLKKFYENWPNFPNMKTMEFSWILEDNTATIDLLKTSGAQPRQTFRLYDKFI